MTRARAVADLTQGTILAVVEIDAPPERVFRALTDPKELVQWWGSPDTYQVTEWQADVRVGGAWRSGGRGRDGSAFAVSGEFVEIDPPRTIVQTWKPDWDGGHTTTIRYQLDAVANGTRVTVRHEGFAGRPDSCTMHSTGWERVLGWLDGHLSPAHAATAPARTFFCRLDGPRPTFPKDMTEREATLMKEHVAYWQDQTRRGKAVVFGPVADPKGTWGLGIIQAESDDELRALQAADPVIRSGLGFRYDTLPFIQAIVREAPAP
jgi:uncharacterized protein YndB with AHSA1/START domain